MILVVVYVPMAPWDLATDLSGSFVFSPQKLSVFLGQESFFPFFSLLLELLKSEENPRRKKEKKESGLKTSSLSHGSEGKTGVFLRCVFMPRKCSTNPDQSHPSHRTGFRV